MSQRYGSVCEVHIPTPAVRNFSDAQEGYQYLLSLTYECPKCKLKFLGNMGQPYVTRVGGRLRKVEIACKNCDTVVSQLELAGSKDQKLRKAVDRYNARLAVSSCARSIGSV